MLTTTDQDVIERFHRACGCGKLFGPYEQKLGTKPIFKWAVSDKAGIERFAERILPMLMPRRQKQIEPILAHVAIIKGRVSSCFDDN